MPAVFLQMLCVAGLLGLAILAIVLSRSKISTAVIYSATFAVSVIALIGAIRWLVGGTANASDHHQATRPHLGPALCSNLRRHLVRHLEAQSPAVPVHPQLPQPRIRGAHRPAAWGVDMALIPNPRMRMVCHDGGEDIA
jgi:hypothetical protein